MGWDDVRSCFRRDPFYTFMLGKKGTKGLWEERCEGGLTFLNLSLSLSLVWFRTVLSRSLSLLFGFPFVLQYVNKNLRGAGFCYAAIVGTDGTPYAATPKYSVGFISAIDCIGDVFSIISCNVLSSFREG